MLIATSLNIRTPLFDEVELIHRLQKAGYEGIDLNLWDHRERVKLDDEAAVKKFLDPWIAAAHECRLPWVQAHGPFFNIYATRELDQFAKSICPQALRACQHVGAPWMVIHPGSYPGAFDRSHRLAMIADHVRFIGDLLPTCEKTGVGIAVENLSEVGAHANGMARRFGSVVEELIDLVDAVNHPLVGICWDTGHARMNQLRDQKAALVAMGPRLKCLHVQENDGITDHHAMPMVLGGYGVNWGSVMNGLREINFAGAWTYEFHNAFRVVPIELYDDMLKMTVQIARHITTRY